VNRVVSGGGGGCPTRRDSQAETPDCTDEDGFSAVADWNDKIEG